MTDTLTVEGRETRGTRSARRQRAAGQLPAVLYGHGQDPVSLSVSEHRLSALLRHGAKLVQLDGAVSESALISNVQWDPFGSTILHIDLVRVSADERIVVRLPIELRGIAPGSQEGGIVEHVVHEVEIDCRANEIPEHLELSINDLHLDQEITADQLKLPSGASIVLHGDQKAEELVLVHCVLPPAEVEAEEGAAAEPELVGRKEAADQEAGE